MPNTSRGERATGPTIGVTSVKIMLFGMQLSVIGALVPELFPFLLIGFMISFFGLFVEW